MTSREIMDRHKKKARVENDTDLSAEQLKNICEDFIAIYKKRTGTNFPLNPKEQLRKAIVAVFDSWNNPRAIKYREIYDIKWFIRDRRKCSGDGIWEYGK